MVSLTPHRIVYDLDSTLINTSMDMKAYEGLNLSDPRNAHLQGRVYRFDLIDVSSPPGTGNIIPMWGVFRPYVFEFLQFSASYFREVYIWSAGQYKYVHMIKSKLFGGTFQPSKTYTYDDCSMHGSNINKPLVKLYTEMKDGSNETNTFALDDREDTFSLNRNNGIQIPVYEPEMTREGIMKPDIALVQLMCWLSLPSVMRSTDIRSIDKKGIFTTSIEDYQRLLSPPKKSSFFPSIVHS